MITLLSVSPGEGLGAETNLADLILAWNRPELPLCMVSPPGSRLERVAREAGISTVPLRSGRDKVFDNLRAALRAAGGLESVQLVHAWNSRAFEAGYRLGQRLGVPACGTLLDHPRAGFHGPFRRLLLRYASNRMDTVVCVSRAVEEACRESGFRGRLRSIHCGLQDLPLVSREAGGLPRIGFLGMYAPWKGFAELAEWIRRLKQEKASWHLFGSLHPDIEGPARALVRDVPGVVHLEGHVPVQEIFESIDLLVHASTGFDPLPNVLVEAARAGLPCLASCRGGGPEIVMEGETGYVIDPGDAEAAVKSLQGLIRDASLREQMGARARARFESAFQVQEMVDQYAELWQGRVTPSRSTPSPAAVS